MPLLRTHWPLLLALGLGLILRLLLWGNLPRTGLISDEAEYLAAADWLAHGRGFAWHTQYLWTRAPLYPLLLGGHIALFGRNLEPIFFTQNLLSLLNVLLTYLLARQLTNGLPRLAAAPALAALFVALYLPLASYTQLLLSETLFVSLLLGAFVLLGAGGQRSMMVAAAGVLLGLATLTRGLTLGFIPLVGLVLLWYAYRARPLCLCRKTPIRPLIVFIMACVLTIAPWSLYATRAYGGPMVVDTTGAFNLALGARTAFDGGRSDEPTRNLVLALLLPHLSLDQRHALLAARYHADGSERQAATCLYAREDAALLAALERAPALSQAERQAILSAEGWCLLWAKPGAFITKSLNELVDLFKINYTGAERLSHGFSLGWLPPWYSWALFILDDTLYVLSLPLALLGWALMRQGVYGQAENGSIAAKERKGTQQRRATQSIPAPLASRLSPLASRLSPLASRLSPLASRLSPPAYLLALIGLWLLYNLGVAPLLFAINRFRIPLMPFVFILAACALVALPLWRDVLRRRYGQLCAGLGVLLLLVATAPYAYLEPRAEGQAATWSSYLGPYPSSLANTQLALRTRSGYEAEQALATALGAGDAVATRQALANPALPSYAAAMGWPLLDALEGRPAAGLERLATAPERPLHAWQTAVIVGELLRQQGELAAARREFGPTLVDNVNPVDWTWRWFFPPPLPNQRIDLADDNDLGYIHGFYLGRYDPDLGATTRWATGHAALRFPAAGNGQPRQLCLALSGLGWPHDLALPQVRIALDGEAIGQLELTRNLAEHCLPLPARPAGATLVVEFSSPTFIADALDLIALQGPQVGQLRQLAFQLAWAEVRNEATQ
ncbi:glycosyltransferase family 39 protein [Candidatus Viridilinea mediisalina]|uniref:glycosyltransferase family 39 protein n=1 Tax=Candidatus Viridilinea mediisalina TaxID=2024553 RepID=UPI001FE61067|nr:glycosyltransferase family 39 protein [Candidatus Viridilinea mediisalina]